jgi:hypothetical protein
MGTYLSGALHVYPLFIIIVIIIFIIIIITIVIISIIIIIINLSPEGMNSSQRNTPFRNTMKGDARGAKRLASGKSYSGSPTASQRLAFLSSSAKDATPNSNSHAGISSGTTQEPSLGVSRSDYASSSRFNASSSAFSPVIQLISSPMTRNISDSGAAGSSSQPVSCNLQQSTTSTAFSANQQVALHSADWPLLGAERKQYNISN